MHVWAQSLHGQCAPGPGTHPATPAVPSPAFLQRLHLLLSPSARLPVQHRAPRAVWPAPPPPRAPLPRGRACPAWGRDTLVPGPGAPPAGDSGSREAESPRLTAAPERPHGPARPSGGPGTRSSPAAASSRERGSGGDRSATGRGPPLGSLLAPFSLQARSKREARANSGGVSPNKPSRQRGARPLRRPAPPGAPQHPPLPIGSAAGGGPALYKGRVGRRLQKGLKKKKPTKKKPQKPNPQQTQNPKPQPHQPKPPKPATTIAAPRRSRAPRRRRPPRPPGGERSPAPAAAMVRC